MIPYFLVNFIILTLCLFDCRSLFRNRYLGLLISFPILIIFLGLRDQTGTDWIFYEQHFYEINGLLEQNLFSFEFGYIYLVKFLSLFTDNYNVFLFLYTLIILTLTYFVAIRLRNPNFFIFLFFTLYAIPYMGTLRQFLALMLFALGVILIYQRKITSMFLAFLASISIHYSSAISILMPVIKKFNLNNRLHVFFIIVIFLISLNFLIQEQFFDSLLAFSQFSPYLFKKLSVYALTDTNTPIFTITDPLIIVRLMTYRLVMIGILYFFYRQDRNNLFLKWCFKIDIFGFIIFLSLFSIFPAIAIRTSTYFTIFEIVAFASVLKYSRKSILCLCLVVASAQLNFISGLIYGADNDLLVPYKSVYYNNNLDRVLR